MDYPDGEVEAALVGIEPSANPMMAKESLLNFIQYHDIIIPYSAIQFHNAEFPYIELLTTYDKRE
jgi:hypothetical protein